MTQKQHKKDFKFLLSIALFCLSLVILGVGVFAITQVNYTIGGSIKYTVEDVFVQVTTRIYKQSESYDETGLKTKAKELEGIGLSTPTDLTYDANEGYSFTTTGNETTISLPENKKITLDYNQYGTYFVVINIQSLTSDISYYARPQVTQDESKINSYFYKTSYQNDIIKPTTGDNVGKNLVLAYTIKDKTSSITGKPTFSYNIEIAIGTYTPPAGTLISLSKSKDATTGEFTQIREPQTIKDTISLTETLDSEHYEEFSGEGVVMNLWMYNYKVTDLPEGNNAINVNASLKDKNGSNLEVYSIAFVSQNCATSSEVENTTPFAVVAKPSSSSLTGNTSIGGGETEFPLCIVIMHTENITLDKDKMDVTISVSSFVDDTSAGLRYTKINGGKELSVLPIDASTLTGEITIPEEYNFDGDNLPVTALGLFNYTQDDSTIGASITGITIPKTIRKISTNTFYGCNKLSKIVFAENSQLTSIGIGAFKETSIESIELPATVTKIGNSAFSSCSNLKSIKIPKNVNRIENDTFRYCNNLTNLQLPSTIEYIGYESISTSSMQTTSQGLVIVDAYDDTSVKYWLGCKNLTATEITKDMIENVKIIAYNALSECTKTITKLEIPASVKCIMGANLDTEGLYSLNFEKLTSISVEEENTIYTSANGANCLIEKSINKLIIACDNTVIPETVEIIGACAIGSLMTKSLYEIPSGVRIIQAGAFFECSNLTTVTLPSSITEIEVDAFWICNKLTSVTYKGTMAQWNGIIKGKTLTGYDEKKIFGTNKDVVVTCTDGTVTVNPSTTSGS